MHFVSGVVVGALAGALAVLTVRETGATVETRVSPPDSQVVAAIETRLDGVEARMVRNAETIARFEALRTQHARWCARRAKAGIADARCGR